jgi:DNA-binding response OmpR family regulator
MKKVLYIDDEANLEKMASKFEIMQEEGIEVISVTRVKDVLPTLQEYKTSIGLIVLDLIMPPEDFYSLQETSGGTTTGLRLLKDIRDKYQDIPIIIVSIRRSDFADEVLSAYKISEYLEKPISAFDLVTVIKNILNKS